MSRVKIFTILAIALAVTCIAPVARADLLLTLSVGNSAVVAGAPGPYATANIHLNSGTSATITFNSLSNNGFIYLMGGQAAADLNVNGAYTLGSVTESNSLAGFTPTFVDNTPGEVDGFGQFNLSLNNFDGFKDTATQIVVNITKNSGTWGSEGAVLISNGAPTNAEAAVHVFGCSTAGAGCTTSTGAAFTGYAANGGSTPVPEATSILFFGTGLLLAGWVLRRRFVSFW